VRLISWWQTDNCRRLCNQAMGVADDRPAIAAICTYYQPFIP
jgi:hypothetical protein